MLYQPCVFLCEWRGVKATVFGHENSYCLTTPRLCLSSYISILWASFAHFFGIPTTCPCFYTTGNVQDAAEVSITGPWKHGTAPSHSFWSDWDTQISQTFLRPRFLYTQAQVSRDQIPMALCVFVSTTTDNNIDVLECGLHRSAAQCFVNRESSPRTDLLKPRCFLKVRRVLAWHTLRPVSRVAITGLCEFQSRNTA